MESKTFKQIKGRKKKKVNGLFVLSFFLFSSLISFSLISCGGGGGGSSPKSEGTINPALFSGWEMTMGPYSGSVISCAVDQTDSHVVYVTTRKSELFKSTDKGGNWIRLSLQDIVTSEDIYPHVVEIAPNDNQVIYVGTWSKGMYISTDGGTTWAHVSDGLPRYINPPSYWSIDYIIIDPNAYEKAYAILNYGYAVCKTVNGGERWTTIYDATSSYNVAQDLVIDPSDYQTLYMATYYDGVYKSTNGGIDWEPKNEGLPQHVGGYVQTKSLAVDPNNPSHIFVGMFDYGLWKTENGAEIWDWVLFEEEWFQCDIDEIQIDPSDSSDQIIYASVDQWGSSEKTGLYKSTDGGENWVLLPYLNGHNPIIIRIALTNPLILYAHAENDGLSLTEDGGLTWIPIDYGLIDTDAKVLSSLFPFNNTIYAGTESTGVFVTEDGGANWVKRNNGLTSLYIEALMVDLKDPQKVYVGTYDDGVFLTINGGEIWEERNSGLSNKYVRAIVIYPADSDVVYAGTRGGIFKTENGGLSWEPKNTGLTDLWIKCLAIDPTSDLDNLILYAGTGYEGESGRVFKTTDGGEIWEDVSNGLPYKPVRSLAIYPFDNQIVYAAFKGEGVYLTKDGGENWVQKNNGLSSTNVITLAISQRDSNIVCAGTEDEGVFAATDSGDNWVKIDGGLSCDLNRRINSITIAPNDEIAYAGTGCGVFKAYK